MGQPDEDQPSSPTTEFIGRGRAPRELKHLSTSRKRKDSLSSGERNGNSSNATRVIAGRRCVSRVVRRDSRSADRRRSYRKASVSGRCLERPTTDGESPVHECGRSSIAVLEYHQEGLHGGNLGRPLSKAKYIKRPIVNEYREGKGKSTPGGE